MPRLRSANGVVVDVSEETAANLAGRGFEPVEEPKKAAAKKATSSKK